MCCPQSIADLARWRRGGVPRVVIKIFDIRRGTRQSLGQLNRGLVHRVPQSKSLGRSHEVDEGAALAKLVAFEGTQVQPTRRGICIGSVLVADHLSDSAARDCYFVEVLRGEQLVE